LREFPLCSSPCRDNVSIHRFHRSCEKKSFSVSCYSPQYSWTNQNDPKFTLRKSILK
jgi:hypothetical protein